MSPRPAPERYQLTRDGQPVATFDTIGAAIRYIHQTHGYSFHHALAHEGYALTTLPAPMEDPQ
jgi:hypothetical protein